jgi:uncharacterized DUF497 family protein
MRIEFDWDPEKAASNAGKEVTIEVKEKEVTKITVK